MVNLRVWTFLWIIVLVIFLLAQFADSKKHRAPAHAHQHHQHHHHHHHRENNNNNNRKSSKIHRHNRHLVKNISRPRNKKSNYSTVSSNMTKYLNTDHLFPNKTISLEGNISNKIKIVSSSTIMPNVTFNAVNTYFTANPNIKNTSKVTSGINNLTNSTNNIIGSSTNNIDRGETLSIFTSTERVTFGTNLTSLGTTLSNGTESTGSEIDVLKGDGFTTEYKNISTESSDFFVVNKTRKTENKSVPINTDVNENHTDRLSPINGVDAIRQLFGATEGSKSFERPFVEIIRKKRSIVKKDDRNLEKRSLLDFEGPAILEDSQDIDDPDGSRTPHKRVKRDRSPDFHDDPSVMSLESNYLQDLEDSFAPSALELRSQDTGASRPSGNNEDSFLQKSRIKRDAKNRDIAHRAVKDEEDKQDDEKNGVISRKRKSTYDNSYPNEENAHLRNRLDDVYPEIIEDPEHPSPLTKLVRTKRYGDGIYRESYANEAGDLRVAADEPYAEDNRFIDSMLSKVDYGSPGEEMESYEHAEVAARGKRDSESSEDKKGGDKSHKRRKKKKGKKKKSKKKKHRKKPKDRKRNRDFKVEDSWSKFKRESRDEGLDGRTRAAYEPEVISPHDGRRRRDYEDENEDNFRFDGIEPSVDSRRDTRGSGDSRRILNDDKDDVSRCAEGKYRSYEGAKIRAKRDNDEFKYYENVSESSNGINGTRNADSNSRKIAAEPIKDIKELARELFEKVNELPGSLNEKIDDSGKPRNFRSSGTSSSSKTIGSRTTDAASKNFRRSSVGRMEKSTPKPFNAMNRREKCRKSTAMTYRRTEQSRGKKLSSNIRNRKCNRKIRSKRRSQRKWDRWTDWSSCSVTCGRGRQIRWRHCVRKCSTAETEMEEKACQLPACAPGKFLGIFG